MERNLFGNLVLHQLAERLMNVRLNIIVRYPYACSIYFKKKSLNPPVHKKRGRNIRDSILDYRRQRIHSFNLLKLGMNSKKIRKKIEYMNTVQYKQC